MKRRTSALLVLILALFALPVLAGCAAQPAVAQVNSEAPHTITVVGSGIAYGSPDIATATVGVQTRSVDPGQAVSDNSERMAALIAAIKALGVAAGDIQTTNFSVYAQQDYDPQTGRPSEAITYMVDSSVSITVRDVSKLGDVLTGAVGAGANTVYGVSFSVADRTGLEADARTKAMADARARAEALAGLAGVTLDTPLSIAENFSGGGPIYMERAAAMGAGGMGGAADVAVEPGQIQVNLQVTVTYIVK